MLRRMCITSVMSAGFVFQDARGGRAFCRAFLRSNAVGGRHSADKPSLILQLNVLHMPHG